MLKASPCGVADILEVPGCTCMCSHIEKTWLSLNSVKKIKYKKRENISMHDSSAF